MKGCDCEDEGATPVVGSAQAASSDDVDDHPVAVLWLPDPSSSSGWCDRWVKKQKPENTRRTGYRVK